MRTQRIVPLLILSIVFIAPSSRADWELTTKDVTKNSDNTDTADSRNSSAPETSTFFPVFLTTAYGIGWYPPEGEEFLRDYKKTGFNTVAGGVFPYGPHTSSLQEFQEAVGTTIREMRKYKDQGFYTLSGEDNLARFPASLRWAVVDGPPWREEAIKYAFEALKTELGEGEGLVDLMDEPEPNWGDTPTPTDGRWLETLGIPDSAFADLYRILASADTWPLGYNTQSPEWVRSSLISWATFSYDDLEGDDIPDVHMLAFYRALVNQRARFRAVNPDIQLLPVTGGTGPYYIKCHPGDRYTPGKDRAISLGEQDPRMVSAQVLAVMALEGFFGVRAYHIDTPHWYRERRGALLAGVYAPHPQGLSRAQRDGSWDTFQSLPTTITQAINTIVTYATDTALLGTQQGIFSARGENLGTVQPMGLTGENVKVIGVDYTNSNIYAGIADKGLHFKDPNADDWVPVNGIGANEAVLCIEPRALPHSEEKLYVGTTRGLYAVTRNNAQKITRIPSIPVNAIYSYPGTQDVYLGTSDGLYILSPTTVSHYLRGREINDFTKIDDPGNAGWVHLGSDTGFSWFNAELEEEFDLSPDLPRGAAVLKTVYVGGIGSTDISRVHALIKLPGGAGTSAYVLDFRQVSSPRWVPDSGAPLNPRTLNYVWSGALQTGFTLDDPIGRAYGTVLPLAHRFYREILIKPLWEKHSLGQVEGRFVSKRLIPDEGGRVREFLIAVNGREMPLENFDPRIYLSNPSSCETYLLKGNGVETAPVEPFDLPPLSGVIFNCEA